MDDTQSAETPLAKIAALLNVPIESFLSDASSDQLSQTLECLKLWQKIESCTGRQRALDSLRRIARDEQAIETYGAMLEAV